MTNHAYQRTDADGNVVTSFDFPDVGELTPTRGTPSIEDRIGLLAVEQAFYKIVAQDVSTRKPGNLRDEVDRHYLTLFAETGGTSYNVRLGGEKVGVASIKQPSAKRAKPVATAEVTDPDALMEWESEDFDRFTERYVREHIADIGRAYFEETGELPDGMDVVEHEQTGAVPAPTVQLRIDPDRVADALGEHQLGQMARMMLGGA